MIRTMGRSWVSPPSHPGRESKKYALTLVVYKDSFVSQVVISNKQMRPAREPLFTIRTQPLGELTPKFWEIARPDRLPHASHGVKEEGQIMVGQEDTRQHLAAHI